MINAKNVYQGLMIEKSNVMLNENEASRVVGIINNDIKIIAPIPSQVILFSIANPLPPGTAETFNTSQLLRQETTFMEPNNNANTP